MFLILEYNRCGWLWTRKRTYIAHNTISQIRVYGSSAKHIHTLTYDANNLRKEYEEANEISKSIKIWRGCLNFWEFKSKILYCPSGIHNTIQYWMNVRSCDGKEMRVRLWSNRCWDVNTANIANSTTPTPTHTYVLLTNETMRR